MNAITRVDAPRGCTPRSPLHLAAQAFVYPVMDGSLAFSDASGFLARAAIRSGFLHDNVPTAAFYGLLNSLERTIGIEIIAIEAEATKAVRDVLRICVERGVDLLMMNAAAEAMNQGRLPQRCVDYLVSECRIRG